jgi:transcriptional regulator with XRE-family HTH domain
MTRRKNISGPRIARARRKANLTQAAVATAVRKRGISLDRAAVAKIENGMRGVQDYELSAFSAILDVPLDWLLGSRVRRNAFCAFKGKA